MKFRYVMTRVQTIEDEIEADSEESARLALEENASWQVWDSTWPEIEFTSGEP